MIRGSLYVVLALTLSALSGCGACFKPVDPAFKTVACAAERQAVDCTVSAAAGLLAPGLAYAKALIDDGTTDPTQLEAALVAAGVKDAVCILSAVAADFSKLGVEEGAALVVAHRARFVEAWKQRIAHVG